MSQNEARVTLFTRLEEDWHEQELIGIDKGVYLLSVETTPSLTALSALIVLKGEAVVE